MPRTFRGIVQKGQRRGSALGFPTVNILLADDSLSGIYAARVKIADDEAQYWSAAYADTKRIILEAHILDFNDDLYGMEVEITLVEKIRDDKKFENEAALRAAIADDISRVREYGAQHVLRHS